MLHLEQKLSSALDNPLSTTTVVHNPVSTAMAAHDPLAAASALNDRKLNIAVYGD